MECTRQPKKRETRKRPENRKKENSERKEEDYTEQTVYKTVINIWTIRCYRLNFEFLSVPSIYVYTCMSCQHDGNIVY